MVNKNKKKNFLIGYRSKDVVLYKTPLKTPGYIVAGLGIVCLGVGVIPNGLGFIMYPVGFWLLGLVGIRLNIKRRLKDKIRFVRWRFGV